MIDSSHQLPISSSTLMSTSVLAAAGHHFPRKPTPWYPWAAAAVASTITPSGLHHSQSNLNQAFLKENKESCEWENFLYFK